MPSGGHRKPGERSKGIAGKAFEEYFDEIIEIELDRTSSDMSAQRKTFCYQFVRTLSYSKAAKAAKYTNPEKVGSELMKIPVIRDFIKKLMADSFMSEEEVFHRVHEMARGDISEFIDANGFVNLKEIRESDKSYLVNEASVFQGKAKVKLYSAQEALKLLLNVSGKLNPKQDENEQARKITAMMEEVIRREMDVERREAELNIRRTKT